MSPNRAGTEKGEERVREILGAAQRCFARDGYHGTSIKAIAAEAGIRSPSILHYHFQSKAAIFLSVMEDALDALTERATEIGLRAEEGARGLEALDAFFALLDHDPDLPGLIVECMVHGARDARDELVHLRRELELHITRALHHLLGDAADRLPLDAPTLAATLLDLLTGHAIRVSLRDAPPDVARQRKGIRTLLALLRPAEAKG